MAIICSCSTAVKNLPNKRCDYKNFGTQIVAVYLQDMAGGGFDGESGNDILLKADWDTRAAAVDATKIVEITDFVDPLMGAPEVQELTGNQVPGGGRIITEKTWSFTAKVAWWNDNIFEGAQLLDCFPLARAWFLTDQGYLFGKGGGVASADEGVNNVTVSLGSQQFPGKGQPYPAYFEITISWADQILIPVGAAPYNPITFLSTVDFTDS